MIPRWARDPLVHFLLFGGALFAFFAWRGDSLPPDSRTITVSREVQAGLSLQFERSLQRAPTDAELQGLIDRWVRDEVLYREALRLGLDQDDAVVRRRLAKKMDGLAGAQAEIAEPSDAVLKDWLKANSSQFETGMRYSFDQLYFSSESAAKAALQAPENETAGSAGSKPLQGEAIALPASVTGRRQSDVESQFGQQFLSGMRSLSVSQNWQGPLVSGFGWHLVKLREAKGGRLPPFAEIRSRVEAEWRNDTIAERRGQAYDLLRGEYTVEVAQ
jgi:hypothetical protein